MYIVGDSLDDLMRSCLETIIEKGTKITSTKGDNRELRGVLVELRNPRARLSRTEVKGTVFSCLGEALWYLSGSNKLEFVKYYIKGYDKYSDDGETTHGAYGPRVFRSEQGLSQYQVVVDILKKKPNTRQAVVQIFDHKDLLKEYKDVPCTCTMQFFIRDGKLDAVANMRSNDIFLGFPHDIFAFTLIQEILACTLGCELGSYKHIAGSLHLYDDNLQRANMYLDEGWMEPKSMPAMPCDFPWPSIGKVLECERAIRNGKMDALPQIEIDDYWLDLIKLLLIFSITKNHTDASISKAQSIESTLSTDIYSIYIRKKIETIGKNSEQTTIPSN